MKEIIDNLNFIKIINFCPAKDAVKRIRQTTDWQKILQKTNLIKDCNPIYNSKYTKNS